MSKIDDLYKRAFGTGKYEYSDSAWDKMAEILDEELPLSRSKPLNIMGLIAAVSALFIFNSSSTFVSSPLKDVQSNTVAQNTIPEEVLPKEKMEKNFSSSELKVVKDVAVNSEKQLIQPETKGRTTATSHVTEFLAYNGESANSVGTDMGIENETLISKSEEPFRELFSVPKLQIVKYSGELIHQFKTSLIDLESTSASASRIIKKPSVVEPIAQLKYKTLESTSLNLDLLPIQTNRLPKLKLKMSPRFTIAGIYGINRLGNTNSLNIDVNSEINNVALVNVKNQFSQGGVEMGVKWKGLHITSGLVLSSHKSAYKMFYSHSKTWQEMQVESETNLSHVDSTFLSNELGLITRNGKTYFGVVKTNYSYDSVYTTTTDTSYLSHTEVKELDEKFEFDVKYVSIPINLNYEHQINRWFISVGAGMQFNMLTNTSGQFYNPETDQVEAFNSKDLLNPVVYVAKASVGLGYNFTPNWGAIIQPHLVSSLNSAFKESTEYSTQHQGYGANLYLRYSF